MTRVGEEYTAFHTILDDESGSAILDLTYEDLLCFFWDRARAEFSAKDLTNDNFNNEGNGVYSVTYDGSDIVRTGPFISLLYPKPSEDYFFLSYAITTIEASTSGSCLVTGQLIDIGGASKRVPVKIAVEVINLPVTIGYSSVIDRQFYYFSDITGYIEMYLIKGSTVRIGLGKTGLVRTVVIPDEDQTDLFELFNSATDDYEST